MAKLSFLCVNAGLYVYIVLRISIVLASTDNYFYETEPEPHTYNLSLKLLENEGSHHLHKRHTEERPDNIIQATIKNNASSEMKVIKFNDRPTSTPSNVNLLQTTAQVSLTLPKNATKANTKLASPPRVPYIFPTNVTRVGTERDVRLLGVNGTGQRKTYPSTSETTVISSTYPPLLHDIAKNISGKPNFDEFVDNISISKFTDKELKKTLAQHNITNETITENYLYYNSTSFTDPEIFKHYWVNLSYFENATTHELLSSAHRRAATVALSFEFPFYGHLIKNVTMATGGFLYTGDYVHAWLAATQYIAPLMANFDTSLSNDSFVRYIDNGTSFTVLWENVALKDRPNDGDFTFQTTLHKNGDIIFAYQNVPTIIEDIKDDLHPVKVGLSDAYIIDSEKLFYIRRKTIYEYHRVNFQKQDIENGTVIIFNALPTCLNQTNCELCLTKEISFVCTWCPFLQKCSNGVDRHRQAWLIHCGRNNIKNETMCSKEMDPLDEDNSAYEHVSNDLEGSSNPNVPSISYLRHDEILEAKKSSRMGISGLLAIMLLISMIVGISMWVFYAYRNPHTTSGQMLIRISSLQHTRLRSNSSNLSFTNIIPATPRQEIGSATHQQVSTKPVEMEKR